MSSGDCKTIGAVLRTFQVRYSEAEFVESLPCPISDYFRDDLTLMMRDGVVDHSEFAICENLIYPVLKEVWKQHQQHFIVWPHLQRHHLAIWPVRERSLHHPAIPLPVLPGL